jgi:hypothetical protein
LATFFALRTGAFFFFGSCTFATVSSALMINFPRIPWRLYKSKNPQSRALEVSASQRGTRHRARTLPTNHLTVAAPALQRDARTLAERI